MTPALKPLMPVTVTLKLVDDEPAATVCEVGVATMEKSVTFSVVVVVFVSVPKTPVTVTV